MSLAAYKRTPDVEQADPELLANLGVRLEYEGRLARLYPTEAKRT